jgi:FAD/FMN-containing dehydrogenase
VRLATQRARPFVRVQHLHLSEGEVFLAAMRAACAGDSDFVDGVVFGPREYVLSTGRFVDRAPWRSDYTYERIYWQAVRERMEDYLSAADYLWRWDTDWFWGSQHFGAQHRIVRQLLGRKGLNSRTWTKWMRRNARWRVSERIAALRGLYRERVIQDADIPMQHAVAFLAFLQREIGISPVWVCPVRGDLPGERFDLYPLDQSALYVNFGFWDVLQTHEAHEPAHFNRLVEAEVRRLGGIKSLYSDSFFTPEEFGAAYGMEKYRALKAKYDPEGRAPDLYDKCVAGA